jgi:hypothetical protein
MSRRDGTGPIGMGPMTGKGMGLCRNISKADDINSVGCFGAGRHAQGFRGRFRNIGITGCMRNYNSKINRTVDEKAILSNQEAILESQLQQVKERLANLKNDAE